ncbi:MAG: hypothetical protein R3253_11870 [Longimicrobiales bacterium]|nr:hypothetical protein [Longimicrobiales bacterium]
MSRPRLALATLGVLALLVGAPTVSGQQVLVGSGVDYQGYTFDDGLGAEAAQLLMVPLAVRVPVGERLTFDLFSAYADGKVEQGGNTFSLSGPVDTSLKASYQATPWARLGVSVSIPTGDGAHDGDEALVASVLSTDLLGFRESTWGTGLAVTSSVGVARQMGAFGVGIAAAYAVRGEFEPSEGDDLTYQPGNEARIRVGLDRNFDNSTLTLGATFINYQEDRVSDDFAADRNLFQAGNRMRFDASYAFRAGAGVWTLYVADLYRQNGDLRVDIVDETNTPVDSSFVQTASQNLIMGGFIGTVALGGGFVFRPHVDYKFQTREEPDGNDAGSGWILAAGGDIPIRLLGTDFFPKARVYFGSIRSLGGEDVGLLGMEFRGTFRVGF